VYRGKNDNQSESWKDLFKFLNINDESVIIEFSSDSTKFRSTTIKSYYDDNHLENSSLFISIIDLSVHHICFEIVEHVSIEWWIRCFERSKIKVWNSLEFI
jgi:hypothetical protein